MLPPTPPRDRRDARQNRRSRRARAFTLVEVMVAGAVMLFAITSSISVLRSGFVALDNARNTTLAAQIIQSEMERLRLLPWDTTSLDATGLLKPAIARLPAEETIRLANIFPAGTTEQLGDRFTVVRTTGDVANKVGEMKQITLVVTWRGLDGIVHTRSTSTHYAKNGLYDYYYTKARG